MTSAIFRSETSRSAMERAYERLLHDTPDAQSRCVTTRFGETHMLVAGPADGPPVVMLHGAMANSAVAMREAQPLLDRFRVYAVDVIGQSVKSADVRLRWDSDDYPAWLEEVLDALGLERAHVYGASAGAFIARRLAERSPQRIDRLVMLVPVGIANGPLLQGMSKSGIPLLVYKTTGSKSALAKLIDSLLSGPDEKLSAYLAEAMEHYKLDISVPPLAKPEALASYDRPTLVIAGEDDITAPGAAVLERARKLIPHAEVELLPKWKHIPPTDDASRAKLCGLVARFLS